MTNECEAWCSFLLSVSKDIIGQVLTMDLRMLKVDGAYEERTCR